MIGLRLLSCVLFLMASSAMAAVTSEGEVIFDGDNVTVGQESDGALTVTPPDGLALDSLTIAQNPGVVGTVLIDGAEISTQNELTIGWRGIGSLSVHNGGQLAQNTGFAYVGLDGVGKLDVQGPGSTVDLTGVAGSVFFFVGGDGSNGGQGEVLVSQGAELLTSRATLGDNGTAKVIVEGNGSLWRAQNDTNFGNAELTLRDGGRLIQTSSNPEHSLRFGTSGGTSSVLVSGPSSQISTTGGVLIGRSGQAVVRVEGGADVMVGRTTTLGQRRFRNDGFPRGILELDGFGTTWTTGDLTLGDGEGHAEVRITNGAVLTTVGDNTIWLGEIDNSSAVVTIDGPNSRWNELSDNSNLYVGYRGRGELRITGGAYHENDTVRIGLSANSANSKVIVSGPGSHWKVRDSLALQQGEIVIADGASMQIQMPDNFRIEEGGHLRLDGGELLKYWLNATIDNRGSISGHGSIDARVNNHSSGVINVGAGQLLEADVLQNSGQVVIEGGELRTAGHLTNSGQMDFRDATLRVEFLNPIFRSEGLGLGAGGGIGREMRFLGGDNRIYGDQINLFGRTVVRGNSTATFFGDVRNYGFFSVSRGSTLFFLDGFSSSYDIFGDGLAVFEGVTRFGRSTTLGTDVTFTSSASWTVYITEGIHDSILSQGVVDLGGELSLSLYRSFSEPGLHELTIIEAASIEGTFDFLPEMDSQIGERVFYRGIEYNDTSVVLLIEQLANGDYNGDGLVDLADYDAWASAFGTTGDSLADGNSDGIVNAADYTLWRDAIEAVQPASVPEPSGLAMVALLGFALATFLETRVS